MLRYGVILANARTHGPRSFTSGARCHARGKSVVRRKHNHRLNKAEELSLRPRRPRRHRPVVLRQDVAQITMPNERWQMELMHYALAGGGVNRVFTLVHVCTRRCAASRVAKH